MTQVGAPKHEPINIGTEATPPFAVLPDPLTLFQKRALRLRTVSPGHDLKGYLDFVAALCQLQHDVATGAAFPGTRPAVAQLTLARTGAMPPLSRMDFTVDGDCKATLDRLLAGIANSSDAFPAQAKDAASALSALAPVELQHSVDAVLAGDIASGGVAETVLLAAALQVHFARTAASLDAGSLQPVADGVCPACGAPPVASMVVGWPSAQNTRFCTCSLCATQWNVVRVKCVTCGSTGGISYFAIEGQSETIKGETCENCRSYVKILYHVNDPALDPVADDIATLALDMKLAQAGWTRRAVNPFLINHGPTPLVGDQDEA